MTYGSQVLIEYAAVDTAKETLEICTSTVGDSKPALETMKNKAYKWIHRAKEGTLSRHVVWFLLDRQLWTTVGYGMSSKTSHWYKITDFLKKKWWQLISLGGVMRTAPDGVRQKRRGLYGVDCPHVGVE